MSLSHFRNNTAFITIQSLGIINNSSQNVPCYRIPQLFVNDPIIFFWNVFKVCVALRELNLKIFLFIRISWNIKYIHEKWIIKHKIKNCQKLKVIH